MLSKGTQQFPELSNISGQRLGASWHKAVQSASARAFRRAEKQGLGPHCREADLELRKITHVSVPRPQRPTEFKAGPT